MCASLLLSHLPKKDEREREKRICWFVGEKGKEKVGAFEMAVNELIYLVSSSSLFFSPSSLARAPFPDGKRSLLPIPPSARLFLPPNHLFLPPFSQKGREKSRERLRRTHRLRLLRLQPPHLAPTDGERRLPLLARMITNLQKKLRKKQKEEGEDSGGHFFYLSEEDGNEGRSFFSLHFTRKVPLISASNYDQKYSLTFLKLQHCF